MLKYIFFILLFFFGLSITVSGQRSIPDSLEYLFFEQTSVFPQEKIYLHTDKPYYITGEKIWFRAYLVDAVTHVPFPASRYIYVELFNPLDSLISRVKIRNENDVYHGHINIPPDIPEGDYTMRAYTVFMLSQDEHYFYTKTFRIGDPQARTVHTETDFTFEPDSRVNVRFRFSHAGLSAPLIPESVNLIVNEGKPMNVEIDDDGTSSVYFSNPVFTKHRIILLETVITGHPYRQFIRIPAPDDDFDVSFYPEGGALLQGTACNIAFKAMKSNGQATNISGAVFDRDGTEIRQISSEHLGMGNFSHIAEKGKTCYAVCTNDERQTRRFDLPEAVDYGYTLSVQQVKDNIYITVLQPPESIQNDELYLLAHTRGEVQYAGRWDHESNITVVRKNQLPSGVLHFILFDAGLNPVSERLVFVSNQDQARINYWPDLEKFTLRSLVNNRVALTGDEGQPLTGSFSVSVTSDREVMPDTASNILTQLLLTSDLRGNIENPAYYFQNGNASAWALDLLMRTQGWRRYDIAGMAQGRFTRPASPIELGAEISGTVKSLLPGKPVSDIEVSVAAIKDSSIYFDRTRTDKEGRFYFYPDVLPDSTQFIVSAIPKKGMTRMELIPDSETFPKKILPSAPSLSIDRNLFALYADKTGQKYIEENSMRIYELPEVAVTAKMNQPRKSQYYSYANRTITKDKIEKAPSILSVLIQEGLHFTTNQEIENYGEPIILTGDMREVKLLVVDDLPKPLAYINNLDISEIEQIDFLKDPSNTAVFAGGHDAVLILVIYTNRNKQIKRNEPLFNIQDIFPLGYQQPVAFYAPKYDTPEKQNDQVPDLRTTIHWQPDVCTDSHGIASFNFYTANAETSYTVVIEGITTDGKIIRKEEKLFNKLRCNRSTDY